MIRKNIIGILMAGLVMVSCSNKQLTESKVTVIETNSNVTGKSLEITFHKGKEHNHPTFAIWSEDLEGNYLETLYVTQYVAKGIYGHGSLGEGKWDNKPGRADRPSTLPYWLHKRGNGKLLLPTPENPVPDAITGATPAGDFLLKSKHTKSMTGKFRIVMEINQPWDWNTFWNNGLYPDDFHYKTSCQPALVYAVTVDPAKKETDFYLNPIGHSHYSGQNGELFTDISTITTAKEIVHKVSVKIKE